MLTTDVTHSESFDLIQCQVLSPVELHGRGKVVVDGDPRDGPAAHLRAELVRVEGEADGDQAAARRPAERRGGRAEEIALLPMSTSLKQ